MHPHESPRSASMDAAEKSSNSSFEDLCNWNQADMKAATQTLLQAEAEATSTTASWADDQAKNQAEDLITTASPGNDQPKSEAEGLLATASPADDQPKNEAEGLLTTTSPADDQPKNEAEGLLATTSPADDQPKNEAEGLLTTTSPADDQPKNEAEGLLTTTSPADDQPKNEAEALFTSASPADDLPKIEAEALFTSASPADDLPKNEEEASLPTASPADDLPKNEEEASLTTASPAIDQPKNQANETPEFEGEVEPPEPKEWNPEPADKISKEEEDICDIIGNGQLTKRVLRKSKTGKRPARGDLVTITYTGRLEGSDVVVETAESVKLHVGDYEVVQGLDMALPLMLVDEVAEIVINPRFAYGSIGLKNDKEPELSIPPNATIKYEVHLLDAKREDYSDLKSYEVRKKYGNTKKERANFWYNRGEFNIAIQLYRRALEYLDNRDGDPDAKFDGEDIELSNKDVQSLLDDRLIVYNNLAMAQIKVSAFDAALTSVEHVLRCQPNNSKALYRKGRILEGKSDVRGAINMLQKALALEPDNKAIQQARREEHNEKEMYQKMLGQTKKLDQKNKTPRKNIAADNSKLKMLGCLMGSVLIGVAGVAFYRYKY